MYHINEFHISKLCNNCGSVVEKNFYISLNEIKPVKGLVVVQTINVYKSSTNNIISMENLIYILKV